jgi:hypothetical protein
MLAKLSMLDTDAASGLLVSHSETSLPLTALPALSSRRTHYYSDGDDSGPINEVRNRDERKLQLQMEIELRKLQLEETQYLQNELRKLAEMPDLDAYDMDKARSLYRQRLRLREQVIN